mmetsp:Transcript_32361/g.34856  ORF Transcript_32361/g.34856 Transcript_32361/m.34856 type:complete len:385 (-) Transcript_32361:164-1318(-)
MFMRLMRFTLLVTASTTTSKSSVAFSFLTSSIASSASHRSSLLLLSRHNTLSMSSSASSLASSLSRINAPTILLRNGISHPSIGFGTYKVGFIPASSSSETAGGDSAKAGIERTASECVKDALDCGYRFLECAEFYGNEHEVGAAISTSGIPREDLFLCSKVWTTAIEQGPDAVEKQFNKTLSDLGTDYIDLYLIHWPVPGKHVEAYKKLQELKKAGKIKGIGVSNYAWEDYVELKEADGVTELPLVNQIEINPFLYRKNTIKKFADDGVILQSYRSLCDGKAFNNLVLKNIASAKGRTAAQIMGRWCHQNGFVYMPKSIKKERMIENAQIFDFELSEEEMNELNGLTTPAALDKFQKLYRKCVNRDTSKDGTMEGVKMDITVD